MLKGPMRPSTTAATPRSSVRTATAVTGWPATRRGRQRWPWSGCGAGCGRPPYSSYGPEQRPAKAWLTDAAAQQAALRRLGEGQPVTFTLADDQIRYEVFVQPVYGEPPPAVPYVRPVHQPNRRRHAISRDRPMAFGLRRLGKRWTFPVLAVVGALAVLFTPR